VSASTLRVRFVESEAQIPPALWDACFPPPLEGRWWYQTLETCGLEDQFAFGYAVIEEGRRPVGIAPIFVMNVPLRLVAPPRLMPIIGLAERFLPSLSRPRTLFVGSPCADEGTVGLLSGVDRRQALACLQDALEAKASEVHAAMLVWKDFPASYDDDLAWLAGERGLFRMVSFPGTVVELPARHKEGYFAALKSSRRYKLKKKLNRSAESVEIDVEVVQEPDDATVDDIFALFRQTYEKAATKFEKLDRRFFAIVATKPASHFVILREKRSRAMLAFMLCFAAGPRIINKFIGIDYGRPTSWSLYFRLWDAALDWSLARGAASIQSGQTGYSAKIECGHRLVPLNNFCRHRNIIVHAVCRAVAQKIRWQTLDRDLAAFLAAHPDAAEQE